MTKRQRRYLRHYRERRNLDVKLSDEFRRDGNRGMTTEMFRNSWRVLDAYRMPQPDPGLEQERGAIMQIHCIQVGWVICASALLIVVGFLTS